MISVGSCDSEDWGNDAKKIQLWSQEKKYILKYLQKENSYFKTEWYFTILLFYCVFDQMQPRPWKLRNFSLVWSLKYSVVNNSYSTTVSYTFSFRNVHVLSHLGLNVSQDCLNKISALCLCERLCSASVKLTFMQLTQTDGFQHIHLAAFLFAVKHGGWQTALGWFLRTVFHQVYMASQQLLHLLYDPTLLQSCHTACPSF